MPVTDTHSEYKAMVEQWGKCRDTMGGEDLVKLAGTVYLPMLESQDPAQYSAYKKRAMFYGATSRTVKGLAGAIMRKNPEFEFPKSLSGLLENLGSDGESAKELIHNVIEEDIGCGRIGLFVDAPESVISDLADPFVAVYNAEDITNWATREIKGKQQLTMVVLRELYDIQGTDQFDSSKDVQYRVLNLRFELPEDEGIGDLRWVYSVDVWRKVENAKDEEERWAIHSTVTPLRRGGRELDYIPFVIINSSSTTPHTEKSPIADLINVNLSHYRNSADLEHGLHFTALPTAWVAGFDASGLANFVIGSSKAWVSDNPQATAGFLEFTGKGLASLFQAMSNKEKLMAILGARLLEEQQADPEGSETLKMRHGGEQHTLARIASAVDEGFSMVLRWVGDWVNATGFEKFGLTLNKDYNTTGLTPQMLAALMEAVQANLMSWDTWFHNIKRGEVTPDARTADEELNLISIGGPTPSLGREPDKHDDNGGDDGDDDDGNSNDDDEE